MLITIHYKRFAFLRVPFSERLGVMWSALCCLVEIGNHTDSLATAIAVNNKVSFISNPGV